ncbi:MAG: alanine-zipper protein [Candidatus Thorarchaeota archaeon]
MSVDKENLLEQVDALRKSVGKALDKIDSLETEVENASSEAEQLRTEKREAEEKAWAAEEKAQKAEEELETLKSDTAKDDEITTLKGERDALQAEMDEITGKLERVSELYRETAAEKEKLQEKVDVSDLLAIYIMLIENIFGGKPHARVLYTLHNTKAAITRKNIEASTGVMPTAVIKAIHDLRNAELVSFDEESQEVKLIKEIM